MLKKRVRQVCIVSAIYAQKMGIGTIFSTRKFSSQRYSFVKHPTSFFKKRQNLFEKVEKLFGSITANAEWAKETIESVPGDYFLVLKNIVSPDVCKIFQLLQLNEVLDPSNLPKFRINVELIGKMSNNSPIEEIIEELWKKEVTSLNANKVKDGLFGFKPPLPPAISAEPDQSKENIPPQLESNDNGCSSPPVEVLSREHSEEMRITEIDLTLSPFQSGKPLRLCVKQAAPGHGLNSVSKSAQNGHQHVSYPPLKGPTLGPANTVPLKRGVSPTSPMVPVAANSS